MKSPIAAPLKLFQRKRVVAKPKQNPYNLETRVKQVQ